MSEKVDDKATDEKSQHETTFNTQRYLGDLTWKEHFFNITALIAIGTSIAAYILEYSPLVTFLGILCSSLGITSAVQQNEISELEDMREITNQLREESNLFKEKCKKLADINNNLTADVEKMKKLEETLEVFVKEGGKSVDDLLDHIKKLEKIQGQIKESLNYHLIQNVISVVLSVDHNEDFDLDEKEMDTLIIRLKESLKVVHADVELDEQKFRQSIKSKNGVRAAVDSIAENIKDESIPEEKKIFRSSLRGTPVQGLYLK